MRYLMLILALAYFGLFLRGGQARTYTSPRPPRIKQYKPRMPKRRYADGIVVRKDLA